MFEFHCLLTISYSVGVSWSPVCQIVKYCLNYKAPGWTLATICALYYNYLDSAHIILILNAFFPCAFIEWSDFTSDAIPQLWNREKKGMKWKPYQSHITTARISHLAFKLGRQNCCRTFLLCQRAVFIFLTWASIFPLREWSL